MSTLPQLYTFPIQKQERKAKKKERLGTEKGNEQKTSKG